MKKMGRFSKATRLVEEAESETYPTFTYSVLEGYIPGRVYMGESKRSALIGTESGIFVVAGEQNNSDFHHSVLEIYKDRKRENKRFTLFSPSKEWDKMIHKVFGNELKQLNRFSFRFNQLKFSAQIGGGASSESKIQPIDEKVISQSQEFNELYLNEYWGSVSNFIENGFGFCLLHNETIASECISIFSSTEYAEIDIATLTRFRGKGFGHIVARKFIEHCIVRNVTPKWDCDVNNFPSIKLGEGLGFENPVKYSVFVMS